MMKPLITYRPDIPGWPWFITSPACRALGIRVHLKTDPLGCPCGRAPTPEVAQSYARRLARHRGGL